MAVDRRTGEKMLWAQAMTFDRFEGMGGEESQDKLDAILRSAYSPISVGELNEDLETVTETVWPEDVVMKLRWEPGWVRRPVRGRRARPRRSR